VLVLRLQAPFAAFRNFVAGAYRPTAPFLTPSAAYGLLMNVAGIETRHDDGKSPMTLTRPGLPEMELALGAVRMPEAQSIYQQLHNYPVGSTGKDRAADCKGNKFNIQPIRRELLSGIDASIWCRAHDPALEDRVRSGLKGYWDAPGRRYGLPFLGDNNLLIDVLREEASPPPAQWLRLVRRTERDFDSGRMRLTVAIHRADMTATRAHLFTWTKALTAEPPEDAWVSVPGVPTQTETGAA